MTEADLRDALSAQIEVLEPGLRLLEKERYIPSDLGTRSFVDLYATDANKHHVLIELKRSAPASREAIHEILKYAEAVKRFLGTRDDEIRVILASTDWRELLVPFSRFMAETKLAVRGLELSVSATGSISAQEVTPHPISRGRLLAPWHELLWYKTAAKLQAGIESIVGSLEGKRISDFAILVLRAPDLQALLRQRAMRAAIHEMAQGTGLTPAAGAPGVPT